MWFAALYQMLFSWLPAPLFACVWVVMAVALFSILVKLIGIILDFFFKFIDIFT